MPQIFSDNPRCGGRKIFTVGDALNSLQAFQATIESDPATASINNCDASETAKTTWIYGIRDGIINSGGEPTEIDFFEKIFGGKQTQTQSTDLYIRYNCAVDYNTYAENGVQGNAPGAAVQFQVMRSDYAGAGKWSKPAVGGMIYVYEDNQWCLVTAVDKTTDFAHLVTVEPLRANYTVNIRSKKPMMFNNTRTVDGLSTFVGNSEWESLGYTLKVQPFYMRTGWDLPLDLLMPYKDVMHFAIMFDRSGQQIDSWEVYEKTKARESFKIMKNLMFFTGQKIDNTLITAGRVDQKYNGFEGYLPSLINGGGFIQTFDPGLGYDLDADWGRVILRQDAIKKTKEFLVVCGLPFRKSMQRRSQQYFKDAPGQLTFDTFQRSGMNEGDIKQLGIDSYKFMGYTMHIKEVPFLSDKRGLGNGKFPNRGFAMPGTGMRDSLGRETTPFEFFSPGGTQMNGTYREEQRYMPAINGDMRMEGDIWETYQFVCHSPENHILFEPINGI